jgi:diguanylate cyclase (GGDEF)-like protein
MHKTPVPAPAVTPAGLPSKVQAARTAADPASALALCDQALADPQLGDDERVALLALRVTALYRRGQMGEVAADLLRALAAAPAPEHLTERLKLLRMGSLACCETGRYEDALRYAHEAMTLADDDLKERVYALNTQASCFERMGDPWQASRLMESALGLIAQSPVDPTLAYARLLTQNSLCAAQLGMFHILRDAGAPDDARDVLTEALDRARQALPLARERGEPWPLVFVEGNLAETLVHLGRPEEALRTLSTALPRARGRGYSMQAWLLRCTWAEACIAMGRAGEALVELNAVMLDVGAQHPVAVLLRLHHALYRAHAELGDVARALHHLEQYLALARERTSRQLQAQSRVLVTRLEMEQARQQAERARHEALQHRRRADLWADAALHDALTGLLNRRGLAQRIGALDEDGGLLTAVMLDVDHFKRINDRYGHMVGDRVLAALAQLLRAFVRPRDVLARYGGEEFTLLLGGLGRELALEVCERLRAAVQQQDWTACGVAPGDGVTVSLGVGLPAPGVDVTAQCAVADAALYRAKALGRNRVECGG